MRIYLPNGDQVEYHSGLKVRVGDVEVDGCSVTMTTPARPGDDESVAMLGPVETSFELDEVSPEILRMLIGSPVVVRKWAPR